LWKEIEYSEYRTLWRPIGMKKRTLLETYIICLVADFDDEGSGIYRRQPNNATRMRKPFPRTNPA
jgi:hypothetical protein